MTIIIVLLSSACTPNSNNRSTLAADQNLVTGIPATTMPSPTATVQLNIIPNDTLLLYAVGGGLKSLPDNPIFTHPQMETIYDPYRGGESFGMYLIGHRPTPSPNGRYLVITDAKHSWLADLVTGELHQFSDREVWASWSPDGQQITYVIDDTLYVLDVGGNQEPIAIFQNKTLKRLFARWSPTGKWIAVVSVAETLSESSTGKEKFTYWLVGPEGDRVKELGSFTAGGYGMVASDLDWSPDGKYLSTPGSDILTVNGEQIPYSEFDPDTDWAKIVSLQLEFNGDYKVSVSHDREQIAYVIKDTKTLQNDIYVFDRASQTHTLVGFISGYVVVEMFWSTADDLLVIGTVDKERPAGGPVFTLQPEPDSTPNLLLNADDLYLVHVIPAPISDTAP